MSHLNSLRPHVYGCEIASDQDLSDDERELHVSALALARAFAQGRRDHHIAQLSAMHDELAGRFGDLPGPESGAGACALHLSLERLDEVRAAYTLDRAARLACVEAQADTPTPSAVVAVPVVFEAGLDVD